MSHLASELASAVKQGNLARLNEILDTLEPDSARQLIDQELLLHLAATYNKPAVLSALLARGASLSHSNALLHNPLQMAVMSGRAAIVSLLLEHQADPNQFSSISVEAIPSSIESQGVRRSNPPLILAIDSQQPAIVQRLLDARADVSRSLDSSGSTAVFHATMSGSLECLTALLRHAPPDSLDINATCGSRGTTALMAAVSNAGVDRARLLIEHRAAIHVRDGEGNTPLFHAARTGNKNAVLLLLKYGAETSVTNNDGRTPAFVASSSVISKLLKSFVWSWDSHRHWWAPESFKAIVRTLALLRLVEQPATVLALLPNELLFHLLSFIPLSR